MSIKRMMAFGALCFGLILAACGRGGGGTEAEPTTVGEVDPVATAVQQTVEAISVKQTVDARTTPQAGTSAAPTSTIAGTGDELPTPESPPSPTTNTLPPPPITPPSQTAACVVVGGINLRRGPGTVYEPPLGALGVGTDLVPLAFSPFGFPAGQWLNVQVPALGQTGWVSFGPQWVSCNIDPSDLPFAGNIPPTPTVFVPANTPTATATATRAFSPPTVENDAPGGSFPEPNGDHVFFNIIVNPDFLFRMDVRDLRVGDFEGAGIREVVYFISGEGVDYTHDEQTAGFCVFGGGEPTCNPWPRNIQGQLTWGEGGPVVVSGEYFVNITVESREEHDDPDEEFFGFWNWNFDFVVTVNN